MKNLLQPAFYATGVASLTYLYNSNINISLIQYASLVPFWMFVVKPAGVLWNNMINKKLAASAGMPHDMKRFKQLFLVSNKAILYDLLSNQLGFYGFLGFALYTHTYLLRRILGRPPKQDFWPLLWKLTPSLVSAKVLLSIVSISTEYWLSYYSVRGSGGNIKIPDGTKRLILFKELMISLVWFSYCMSRFYVEY